jgi:hypothetical protein
MPNWLLNVVSIALENFDSFVMLLIIEELSIMHTVSMDVRKERQCNNCKNQQGRVEYHIPSASFMPSPRSSSSKTTFAGVTALEKRFVIAH